MGNLGFNPPQGAGAGTNLSSVGQDVVPASDNTYDLGSSNKRWAVLWAVLAIMGSLVIGTAYKVTLGTGPGGLSINDSVQINGSLNVSDNISSPYFIGDGSLLTGISATIGNTSRIDFPSVDVSIVDGTNTWLKLIGASEPQSTNADRNLNVYNLLARNVIELSGQGKLIYGYTDVDKYVLYNSTEDNITWQVDSGANFHFKDGVVYSDEGFKGNFSGFLDCTNITGSVSNLCSIVDTDTDTYNSTEEIRDAVNNTPGVMNLDQVNVTGNMTLGNHTISWNSTTLSIRVT